MNGRDLKLDGDSLSRQKRVWSLGTGLYEIVLLDKKGQPERLIRKTAAPGYWIYVLVCLTLLILMIVVILIPLLWISTS